MSWYELVVKVDVDAQARFHESQLSSHFKEKPVEPLRGIEFVRGAYLPNLYGTSFYAKPFNPQLNVLVLGRDVPGRMESWRYSTFMYSRKLLPHRKLNNTVKITALYG